MGTVGTMAETEIYKSDGVLVTTTRFVAGGVTYAMSSVSAVTIVREDLGTVKWVLFGVVGSFMVWMCGGSIAQHGVNPASGTGLFLGLLGAASFFIAFMPASYWLVLQTTAGTVRAYKCKNAAMAATMSAAIEKAIIDRG